MGTRIIKVFSLCNEINLNKIAAHFGIDKKYRWEEFLVLRGNKLNGIINDNENKQVNVFYFGSIAFVNMEHHEIVDTVNYLKKIENNLSNVTYQYFDDYTLDVSKDVQAVNYNKMLVTEYKDYQLEILSIVLAKSVALERIENGIDNLLDKIEGIVNSLKKGLLNVRTKELSRILAEILGFKFNTISYIMLLDKPDITWDNQESEKLYTQLAKLFELDERYDKIKAKSEVLMDITEVFATLSHQKKGNRLEWIIISLIFFEIILTLVDYIFFR